MREMEGSSSSYSDENMQLIEERDRLDSISMGTMLTEFVSRLPDKIKDCLDPENLFQIDADKSENLVPGEKEYYNKQLATLRSYEEVDSLHTLNEIDEFQLEEQRNSKFMMKITNYANIAILVLKIYTTIISGSIAIAASTFDSLLDLIASGVLWSTYISMKNKIVYKDQTAKLRGQPVVIVIFTAVLAILGIQVLIQSFKQLIGNEAPEKMNTAQLAWLYSILFIVTITKLGLWFYCRISENKIIHAFSNDHYFDVVINMFSWGVAVVGNEFYWWIDPSGAIIIVIYTISNWSKILWKNTASLIGQSAPPEFLKKLIYLVIRHHPEIITVDTANAYTFGAIYLVEVDIQVAEDLPFKQAHEIEESLQTQIEKLPEVGKAFIHLDYDSDHSDDTVEIEATGDLLLQEARAIEEPIRAKIEKISEIEFESDHDNIVDQVEVITENLSLKDEHEIRESVREQIEELVINESVQEQGQINESVQEQIEELEINESVQEQIEELEINESVQEHIEELKINESVQEQIEEHEIKESVQEQIEEHEINESVQEQIEEHKINESVQEQIEELHKIEREFVHVDFDSDYKDEDSSNSELSIDEPETPSQGHS